MQPMNPAVRDVVDPRSGRAVRLTTLDGKITALEPLAQGPAGLPVLLPPLVDIQVNGYAGVDFQRDDCTAAELERAAEGLAAAACGRFLLTFITNRWDRMLARLRHYQALRAASPRLRRRIAGWHLEGPFMSPQPGFHGAHPPECMEAPSAARMHELKAVVGDEPTLLTMAPEWPEAPAAIRVARELGFHVWLGHTDATAEQIAAAVAAGAEGFTHLGNGCPAELHRHDNIIFRVLDEPRLRASLIPDRIHVSPVLFRLMHQVLGEARICYTTDAMAAAGAGPGTYDLAGMRVEVGADGIVRQPGKANYAGSSLAPLEGIRRAAAMLRQTPLEVWPFFSTQPAAFMGLPSALSVGAPADYCLLHETAAGVRIEIHLVGEPVREVVWSA
jgi:N-acetylglucosamine-6-phosphate deacetylase